MTKLTSSLVLAAFAFVAVNAHAMSHGGAMPASAASAAAKKPDAKAEKKEDKKEMKKEEAKK
jgi:ribosomal protein L12E/L44/L45/RPP1/RPP2